MKKYIAFSLIITLASIVTKSHAYCVYNQTGLDISKIRVTVYRHESNADDKLYNPRDVIKQHIPHFMAIDAIVHLPKIIGALNHTAQHVISTGKKACWNWESIQHQLHSKKLNELWFVIEKIKSKNKEDYMEPFIYKGNIHDGLFFCVKNRRARITVGQPDSRCGSQP